MRPWEISYPGDNVILNDMFIDILIELDVLVTAV